MIQENYAKKLVGHAGIDSTAMEGRERACRIAEKKPKNKKKRGRKSTAEKEAMLKAELEELHTRRLAFAGRKNAESQSGRSASWLCLERETGQQGKCLPLARL